MALYAAVVVAVAATEPMGPLDDAIVALNVMIVGVVVVVAAVAVAVVVVILNVVLYLLE